MSDQQPATPPGAGRRPGTAVSVLLFLLGVVLLLPGLCSLVFAVASLGGSSILSDPTIVGLWLVCFAIAAGGVALISFAIRRQRRR
jgi:ABC-type dipeptide/oligopeptide/nickel transport system permease subunit